MPSPAGLSVDDRNGVLRVVIDRPERRNPLSLEVLDGIHATFSSAADRDDLILAIVTGAGDRAFASGGDLEQLSTYRTIEQSREVSERGRRALDAIRYCPVPVYAVINGYALGGGAELALACDVRIALPNARLGFVQSTLNTCTPWGGIIDLIGLLGYGQATRCVVEGQVFDAISALDAGLVEHVADDPETILAPLRERKTQVMRGFKATIAAQRRHLHDRLAATEEQQAITSWAHADHWTAHDALREK